MTTVAPCCLKGIKWDGTPTGTEGTIAGNKTYIAGSNAEVAVLLIHDLYGWTFPNLRLLADAYAAEVGATVYLPDFFGGLVVDTDALNREAWHEIDMAGFMATNGRQQREPEIFAVTKALRSEKNHIRVGVIGFCYGGWAGLRLASDPSLVDCVSIGHPSLLIPEDIEGVRVPVQVLAPEKDPVFTDELKRLCFEKIPAKGVHFDYQFFPGVQHACFSRGDPSKEGERLAMVRGKIAAVSWFRQFLLSQG